MSATREPCGTPRSTLVCDRNPAGGFLGNHSVYDSFIADHLVDAEGRGILFRQYAQHVEPIRVVDSLIEFDAVTGRDAKRSGDLVSQVYHRQNQITSLYTLDAENSDRLKDSRAFREMVAEANVKLADAFRRAARVSRQDAVL